MKIQEDTGGIYTASPLLKKAQGMGLVIPEDLSKLAVVRGLRYYDGWNQGEDWKKEARLQLSTEDFSNAELGIALLSPQLPHVDGSAVQVRQRIASAVLSASDVDPVELTDLAKAENCEPILRWIATCGDDVETGNPFWQELLSLLPDVEKPEKAPHPTRFFEMTGLTQHKVGIQKRWLRLPEKLHD